MQEITLYTLKALSGKIDYHYAYLRSLVSGFDKKKVNQWGDVCFIHTGSQWLAYYLDESFKVQVES